MKTKTLLLLCAILALAACSSDDNVVPLTPTEPEQTEPVTPITFNLTATRPGDTAATRGGDSGGWQWQSWDDDEPDGETLPAMTRAGKQDWEAGDAIFVFFNNVSAPKHIKMTYDGSAWTSVEYDGATPSPGALCIWNGQTGTMTAVYLPYGSDTTISASEVEDVLIRPNFMFSKPTYAYYMTGTLPYEVVDNTVSGAFDMKIADNFVQFFVPDDNASADIECLLGTDAVTPVGVFSVSPDGTITETSTKELDYSYIHYDDGRAYCAKYPWDDLPGFFYYDGTVKGYIFYGRLCDLYTSDYDSYYFSKTKPNYIHEENNNFGNEWDHPSGYTPPVIRDERYDYFVSGKKLASHAAIKLPAASDINRFNENNMFPVGKWLEVGKDITIKLQNISNGKTTDLGTWYTCNYGQSVPESLGDVYTFDEAQQSVFFPYLPSKEKYQTLIDNCTWTWTMLHKQYGIVAKCNSGFLFFHHGAYWTGTPSTNYDEAYALAFENVAEIVSLVRTAHPPVRLTTERNP